jgi:hypothetical protein
MGMLRKLARGGAAAGLLNMAMREARKPENQRKAKELMSKAQSEVQARRSGRRPARPAT